MSDSGRMFAAFFRNVNLGQRGNPSRAQLEEAFLQAGASQAISFQSNGTVIFPVPPGTPAANLARKAAWNVRQACGKDEPVFTCTLEHLATLAAEDPFAAFSGPGITERSITFFDPGLAGRLRAPLETPRGDCLVFRIGAGEALSISRVVEGKSGHPNPMLEAALEAPVTTRSWGTILRLLGRPGRG